MKTITRREFVAWLKKQDPARTFNYMMGKWDDENKCPIAAFLSETRKMTGFYVGGSDVDLNWDEFREDDVNAPLPKWLWSTIYTIKPETAGAILEYYDKSKIEPHLFSKPKAGQCRAFLHCKNKATTTIPNVILGPVPCCARCKKKLS